MQGKIPVVPAVSATIITLNEAEHIAGAIDSLSWADEVIVVDCGSSDDTVAIARRSGARVEYRAWSGWIDQKNFAASLARNDWILSLDADERVSTTLATELQELLRTEPPIRAYRMPRVTFHLGRWIRTTDFYPDYQTRLYDRRAARWRGKYVHESVALDTGKPGQLRGELLHYSFRDLRDQLDRINTYTTLGARQMYEAGRRASMFHLWIHPPAAFLRNYILRRGILDGTAGLTISLLQAWAVFLKFAKLWELARTPNSQLPRANVQFRTSTTAPDPSPTPERPRSSEG
jgi:glycosyltransferase involved in cell wall biosynthesis